jgi:membrane carboxypeptidase/penicillin-binding protein PbpC
LTLPDRPVAAKTGTTNDFHDAWSMGFTPSLACGVWVGNNDNAAMKKGADGSAIAAPIWNEFMRLVTASFPVEAFNPYEVTKTGKPVLDGEPPFEQKIKIDKYTGKLATEFTPQSYIIEKQFSIAHNILHYVKRDDPLGSAPGDPATYDWQYANWEAGVQEWVKKNNIQISGEPIPTEYDDAHTLENKPTIFLLNPQNGATISGTMITADVKVSAPRGSVGRVEYSLDDKLIAVSDFAPYSLNYEISKFVAPGSHKLKATAFDDIDNFNFVEINIVTTQTGTAAAFGRWIYPQSQSLINMSSSPLLMKYQLSDLGFVKKITFYGQRNGEASSLISTIISPSASLLDFSWQIPDEGVYQLWPVIEDVSGTLSLGEKITVSVAL